MGVLIEIPQKKIHPDNRIIRQPKDIYELAEIQNINESDKVALVHNHPSGILEPSKEDINITITTGKLLKLFNIELIDHVIVSEKNYLSILFTPETLDKSLS